MCAGKDNDYFTCQLFTFLLVILIILLLIINKKKSQQGFCLPD